MLTSDSHTYDHTNLHPDSNSHGHRDSASNMDALPYHGCAAYGHLNTNTDRDGHPTDATDRSASDAH